MLIELEPFSRVLVKFPSHFPNVSPALKRDRLPRTPSFDFASKAESSIPKCYTVPPSEDYLAISCTSVGVGPGGSTAMLARVVLVDFQGQLVLDHFVTPTMPVTDYRTSTTGIIPEHLTPENNPVDFERIQGCVSSLISGRVLVGHCIWQDLSVLGIPHPAAATRDVALYLPFRTALRSPNQIVGLQTLMWHLMSRRCQYGYQDPLENSRAAMDLYRSHDLEWESTISKGNWPCAIPPSTFSRCFV